MAAHQITSAIAAVWQAATSVETDTLICDGIPSYVPDVRRLVVVGIAQNDIPPIAVDPTHPGAAALTDITVTVQCWLSITDPSLDADLNALRGEAVALLDLLTTAISADPTLDDTCEHAEVSTRVTIWPARTPESSIVDIVLQVTAVAYL